MTHARAPHRQASPARAFRAAGLAALLAATTVVSGCARIHRTIESYTTTPSGLALPDDRLRRTLSLGRWDSAMVRAADKDRGAPGDRLLRGMYAGLVAYYAGDFDRSAGAFERVWTITDDRQTRKLSKEAASLVTNDRALPWTPSPSERLLARHYAMLGFLRKDDVEGAAVEARRLVLLLQELDDQRVPVEPSTRAMLHYVAGAVFEAAGERNDADVAWRNAAALGLSAPGRAEHDDSATVLVLVEHGWVAHKVERSLTLGFGTRDEIALFADEDGRKAHQVVIEREAKGRKKEKPDDEGDEDESAKQTLEAAKQKEKQQQGRGIGRIGDVLSGARPGTGGGTAVGAGTRAPDRAPESGDPVVRPRSAPIPPPTRDPEAMAHREKTKTVTVTTDASPVERLFGLLADEERDEWYADQWDRPMFVRSTTSASYVLTIAWPAFARPEPAPRPMAVTAWDGDSLVASDMPLHVASLSDALVSDFRRERSAIFARAVARAATKYWLAEQAEKKKKWAGLLVNAAGDLLEHADTRSWNLLPGEVSLVRLRVPAGTHTLAADLADARRGVPAHLELGRITVRAGETRIVTGRVWASSLPRPPLPVAPRTAGN